MSAIDIAPSVTTTLVLRSEQCRNLTYIVELETKDNTLKIFTSENYFQALTAAQKVFDKLKNQDYLSDFGVMIEAHQGRGVTYTFNEFTFDATFDDTEIYYRELCNDFEHVKFKSRNNNNKAFRKVVKNHGLNEYQEQRFLKFLKRLGCLS